MIWSHGHAHEHAYGFKNAHAHAAGPRTHVLGVLTALIQESWVIGSMGAQEYSCVAYTRSDTCYIHAQRFELDVQPFTVSLQSRVWLRCPGDVCLVKLIYRDRGLVTAVSGISFTSIDI